MLREMTTTISLGLGLVLCSGAGCSHNDRTLADLDQTLTVAVAPALNHSGSREVDALRMADLMASELTHCPGVRVIPLNRVLAQLAADNTDRVESADHALRLRERLGADAVVIMAVTEYDPYNPPVLGLTAQLYGESRDVSNLDPVSASRRTTPFESGAVQQIPRAEYQRVFDGTDQQLEKEMREFLRGRNADDSPYGWRKFLASQDDFLRFCCARTAQELIRQEVVQLAAVGSLNEDRNP